MGVQYEVTAVTGKYTDLEGKEKNRYLKIGVVVESKNGPMLKLEAVPVGWDGWAYLNTPRPREEAQGKPYVSAAAPMAQHSGSLDDGGDSIPF